MTYEIGGASVSKGVNLGKKSFFLCLKFTLQIVGDINKMIKL